MTTSTECQIKGEGCQMCSDRLRCDCSCHVVLEGETCYHRCNICGEQPNSYPECVYSKNCPWKSMTCPHCGEGEIVHSKE